MPLYKFGVIRTLMRDAQILVSGSVEELGSWNQKLAVPLGTSNYILEEPSFWTADIEITSQTPFEYKFLAKYVDDDSVEWEGYDSNDNRTSEPDEHGAKGTVLLTPSWWKEKGDDRSEIRHTLAFYYNKVVCDGHGIHFW